MACHQAQLLLLTLAGAAEGGAGAYCNARLPQPVETGTWGQPLNDWTPSGGCKYRTWDATTIQNCMAGSWFVLLGGSNLIALHIQLQQMVGIDTTNELLTKIKDGSFGVADSVVKDGAQVYFDTTISSIQHQSSGPSVAAFLKSAPAPADGVRITVFRSNLWSEVDLALDLLECDAGAWSNAPLSIATEIGSWYTYCIDWQESWCPYKQLMSPTSKDTARATVREDMVRNMKRMNTLCAPNNRGGVHGCTILAPHYMVENDKYRDMTLEAMGSCNSKHLRFFDLFDFLEPVKNVHMQRGHQDPVSATWMFQVLISAACSTTVPSNGADLTFTGDLCSAKDFQSCGGDAAEDCPALKALCPDFVSSCSGWCPKEMCQHALPCTYSVSCTTWDCNPSAEATEVTTEMPVDGCDSPYTNWCEAHRWVPIDGGTGRACRTTSGNDNPAQSDDTYVIHQGTANLDACKELCKADDRCLAIEYGSGNQRCEVWRTEVKASTGSSAYTCLKYYGPIKSNSNDAGATMTSTTSTTSTTSMTTVVTNSSDDLDDEAKPSSDSKPSEPQDVDGASRIALLPAALLAPLLVGMVARPT